MYKTVRNSTKRPFRSAQDVHKISAPSCIHSSSAITYTTPEVGGERLVERNFAENSCAITENGVQTFAVAAEQPEKDNPLRTAEMTLEDDYGMIDGVINNGRCGEELEKAQDYAERTTPENPSSGQG